MDKKWILVALVVLIVFGMKDAVKKESVAAISGQPCLNDSDCPCWGTYNVTAHGGTIPQANATAYGLGIASCENNKCDMTYCMNIQPVGAWLRDNPWSYLRDNPLITIGVLGLLVAIFAFLPKTSR